MSIRTVQTMLAAAGFDPGRIDGKWGDKTRIALETALAAAVPASPPPLGPFPKPVRPARRLTPKDIADAAAQLRASPAHVKAVLEVECGGAGFGVDGRPIIRPEGHKFSQFTGHRFDTSHPDLSWPHFGAREPPETQSARWAVLSRMISLDRLAALRATSWGLPQIMGFNHAEAGFASVDAFVEAMFRSERDHLHAFVSLIRAFNLDDELREGRWSAFALGYNGPQYGKHGYHTRLHAAFARHVKADARAVAAGPAAA